MVTCKIVAGDQQTPLIGAYLSQSTLDHLYDPGRYPIVLGDLNMDIGRLRNPQDQQVADFLVSFGLVNLLGHFCQPLRYCNLQTWWRVN